MSDAAWYSADIDRVVVTEEQIQERIGELAKQVGSDFATVE